ncbi:interleukin enhancer-binding factor 3-like, partial [Carica papaya]|uniref:interleukin enhancer-binding factor 3-like n=1 Tax=Carica papaya TaxID=3649 RepID=UPI000B8CE9B6
FLQASKHPFVTGEPFTCPYKPPPETPRMPVTQNIKVDHHPGGGHWFAAGLSPNIPGRNRVSLHNSPHFHMVPYTHANSYGSVGSHGSYNDGTGLGSSYGSYGDSSNMFAYYSPVGHSGMNMHAQGGMSMLGSSPDARRRIMQYSHGSGLGMSPSAGNFAPLPLGTSPSQFTPPSSYGQVSGGSPGHYGPPSPARSSCHGSPLGKMAAVSQFNRRKSWGYPGSSQSQDNSSSSHWQGQSLDGNPNQTEGNSQVIIGSPSRFQSNSSSTSWKQQQGGSGNTAGYPSTHNMPNSLSLGTNLQFPPSKGVGHENPEAGLSMPDPGDWDPNYSDELLLQEDGSDESSLATELGKSMHLGSAEPLVSVGRFSHASNTCRNLPIQR